MRKVSMAISILIATALLVSGCTIHNKTNGWIYEDTDGDGIIDRGYRQHDFIKPEETGGAYIDHLNMDEKIIGDDGKIIAVNHKNVQYVVNPPDLEPGVSAVGYEFSDQALLWVAVAEITEDGSGDVYITLDMTGQQARTLYNRILDIVAVGARYEDGAEYWADAQLK